MRITHANPSTLTARHVPWQYWLLCALLLSWAVSLAPSSLDVTPQWLGTLILLAAVLLILLTWGRVVQVEIDRQRKRVLLKRWGAQGLRMRVFPFSTVTAIYMERHANDEVPSIYRVVLMEDMDLVPLTPFLLLGWGLNDTAQRMHDYLRESRAPAAEAALPGRAPRSAVTDPSPR
jgi:hypothetical protein